ncbi:MAG: OmpA family protein [Bacteroidia bacterium]|nr:OmpA family protein [Bacteroidia bacterium]
MAQIVVQNTTADIEKFVKENLLGNGIVAYNFKYSGNLEAMASFTSSNDLLKIPQGILLSTGKASDVAHANDVNNQWSGNATRGDKDLNRIGKGITIDAAVLEFDFIATRNKLEFEYFFASEEYMEYAESKYNDVFAFVVSGVGARKKNIALLPDKKTIVSVNNINQYKNGELYINNNIFTKNGERLKMSKKKMKKLNSELINYFQYDGLTVPMKAEINLIPGKKYHIKIAIADVGDFKYDSGVFIKKNSFSAVPDSTARTNTVYVFNPADTVNSPPAPKVTEPTPANPKTIKPASSKTIKMVNGKPTVVVNTNAKPKTATTAGKKEYLILSNIYFGNDSYIIPDSAFKMLDKLASSVNKNKSYYLEIMGFTDSTGSVAYNRVLSINRAKSVFDYLAAKFVDEGRINFEGFGSNNSVADNKDERNRLLNRRVEIKLKEEVVIEK